MSSDEGLIGRIIADINVQLARPTADSPAVHLSREAWDIVIRGLQGLTGVELLLRRNDDLALLVERLQRR